MKEQICVTGFAFHFSPSVSPRKLLRESGQALDSPWWSGEEVIVLNRSPAWPLLTIAFIIAPLKEGTAPHSGLCLLVAGIQVNVKSK